MQKPIILIALCCAALSSFAQTPKAYTSSEILLHLKKLDVLGSVLYIAAHPDDENTRLLAWLANEKLYRTGYLSLTRGDGGQNLIGNEQGIELGLIRTQELLSARRLDGAEQFFSRAFDFGFCKNPEEALRTWGHDKILSDVVWVIRKFRPDVIITRFPEDSRAGHGHHSASAILAREAFAAAADSTKFPEQLKEGVTVWQAKRLLWNTYNFGGNNTQSEDQFKLDCGGYNPLLGKSYGEIAALSRSQHKSQGFGVPAQRGQAIEYFSTTKGDKPVNGLLDGVATDWSRVNENAIGITVEKIINEYSPAHPENSVPALVQLYQAVQKLKDGYWKEQKLKEIQELVKECSGLFMEVSSDAAYAVKGDSLQVTVVANSRLGVVVDNVSASFFGNTFSLGDLKTDENAEKDVSVFINYDEKPTQPYWLEQPMNKGSFNVSNQQLIGKAENDPVSASFIVTINGVTFKYNEPIRYKYTDPVRGELYEPLFVIHPLIIQEKTPLVILNCCKDIPYNLHYKALVDIDNLKNYGGENLNDKIPMKKGEERDYSSRYELLIAPPGNSKADPNNPGSVIIDTFYSGKGIVAKYPVTISYDHIPTIVYLKPAVQMTLEMNLKTAGKLIGYIPGAGDKVPAALEQMGYKVTMLKQSDITAANLKQYDAIITGVRAYNVDTWLNNVYDTLMDYVKNGGVMIAQYNTNNNSISSINSKIGPYPFTVVNKRVTDETATVNFLLPNDPILNYPNKITSEDFDGWIQERSIYDVTNIDSNYRRIFTMHDPGETDQDGSLIVANYGKGKFVYTGLVFFRELPAGVPGAYRLFANLIAK